MPPSSAPLAGTPSPAAPPSAPGTADLGKWFADEVHPHQDHLKAFLRGTFPKIRDVDDLVQESYLRIFKARLARPIQSTRSFLFQIVRHLAIDALRHQQTTRTDSHPDLAPFDIASDEPAAPDLLSDREKISVLGEALAGLPERCREIFILRKLKGLSHREIAQSLGIAESTIECHVNRGMKFLSAALRERGLTGYCHDE